MLPQTGLLRGPRRKLLIFENMIDSIKTACVFRVCRFFYKSSSVIASLYPVGCISSYLPLTIQDDFVFGRLTAAIYSDSSVAYIMVTSTLTTEFAGTSTYAFSSALNFCKSNVFYRQNQNLRIYKFPKLSNHKGVPLMIRPLRPQDRSHHQRKERRSILICWCL